MGYVLGFTIQERFSLPRSQHRRSWGYDGAYGLP